jgi:hypothetical protein
MEEQIVFKLIVLGYQGTNCFIARSRKIIHAYEIYKRLI